MKKYFVLFACFLFISNAFAVDLKCGHFDNRTGNLAKTEVRFKNFDLTMGQISSPSVDMSKFRFHEGYIPAKAKTSTCEDWGSACESLTNVLTQNGWQFLVMLRKHSPRDLTVQVFDSAGRWIVNYTCLEDKGKW